MPRPVKPSAPVLAGAPLVTAQMAVLAGIGFMLLHGLAFAVMSNTIRYISVDYPAPQIVFMRNVFSLICLLPWVMMMGLPALKTRRWKTHGLRALSAFLSMSCWFYALSIMPVPDAVALTYTTPLFLTILAVMFLGETIHLRRVLAVVAGFIGVMVVIRPGFDGIGWEALAPLSASLFAAIGIILIKPLSRTESSFALVVLLTLFMIPMSAPMGIYVWQSPDLEGWVGLATIGVASTLVQYGLTKAYSLADVTVLLPFDFMRLVFTALIAYVIFGDMLDGVAFIGAGMILASTLYIAHREAMLAKRSPSVATD